METRHHPSGPTPMPAVRVGVGGWTFAPWRKTFYPDGLPQRRELEFASRKLRVIEINGTFYRAQSPATYAKWAGETPPGFVFSLKAPRYVVEARSLAGATRAAAGFVSGGLEALGDRLGPVLWQLGPTRAFDPDDLAAFLDALPRELNGLPLRHVLEVRHPSFLDPRYVALARAHQIPTVVTDATRYPSLADLTGPFVYARLMQSEQERSEGYAPQALDAWAARTLGWARGDDPADLPHVAQPGGGGSAREVFVFFIGSAKVRNPAAAMALQARVDAAARASSGPLTAG